jgi:hypothetical protein
MIHILNRLLPATLLLFGAGATCLVIDPPGVRCRFKDRELILAYPLNARPPVRAAERRRLDTLSNWYDVEKNYVEIIRQDDPARPTIGIALGFEFDAENGDYPYTPERAVLQLKDFAWGGVEFSRNDTSNYTGVSDRISDDLTVEIDTFYRDTIVGRFSGLLLSGAGKMAWVEEGRFKVRVFSK